MSYRDFLIGAGCTFVGQYAFSKQGEKPGVNSTLVETAIGGLGALISAWIVHKIYPNIDPNVILFLDVINGLGSAYSYENMPSPSSNPLNLRS
jgi:hypothetical protein